MKLLNLAGLPIFFFSLSLGIKPEGGLITVAVL